MKHEYNAFICHASEDKEPFVRELVSELQSKGVKIWYDESAITVGDSLLQKINDGLQNSEYGIVVFSKAFFDKSWPKKELDGLVALEIDGRKKILPIWFDVQREDILKHYPILANLFAADYRLGMDSVVRDLLKVLIPETEEKEVYIPPTVFFHDRIAEAFPGIRGLYEIQDRKEIITRLSILLREPLQFQSYFPSFMLFDMNGGTLDIGNFQVLNDDKVLIVYDEIIPKKLIVYRPMPYWQDIVYLESEPDTPTGIYSSYGNTEEYAINEDGTLVTREEYDDACMFRDGKSIPLGVCKIRRRYFTPTNLIITSRFSPINRNQYDSRRLGYLKGILTGKYTIQDFIDDFERLPKHDKDC